MQAILGILGATGVGKSALAVELAIQLNSAVISADSMQVYKGMDIGTAKITKSEMRGVQHYMLDVITPDKEFNAFLYSQMAEGIIADKFDQSLPIMAGGTGLYFDCLLYGLDYPSNEQTQKVREEMNNLYSASGAEAVLDILRKVDFYSYERIDKNNIKRVIRAIEIASQGKSMFGDRPVQKQPKYDNALFALTRSRDQVYRNIDQRVDKMVQSGLVEEVQTLCQQYPNCNTTAFQAIGYKEVIDALSGHYSMAEAVERIKLNSRHYAKRQMTYFRRMKNVVWIDVEQFCSVEQIAKHILAIYLK